MHFVESTSSRAKRFRFTGNPFVVILAGLALLDLFLIGYTSIKLLWDGYMPYEGKVLNVRTHWTDYITGAFVEWERLTIVTPQNKTVDKYVSRIKRANNNIKQGKYVFKKRGFRNDVKPRNKKTGKEMLKEFEEWSKEFQ